MWRARRYRQSIESYGDWLTGKNFATLKALRSKQYLDINLTGVRKGRRENP
jgi:hypothetical protein